MKSNLVINETNDYNAKTNIVQSRKIVLKRSHLNSSSVPTANSQVEMSGEDLADHVKKSKLN